MRAGQRRASAAPWLNMGDRGGPGYWKDQGPSQVGLAQVPVCYTVLSDALMLTPFSG